MRARPLPAAVLCASLALGSAVLGSGGLAPAAAVDPVETVAPVRIMLAGDSITQGFDGDYTWRYRLYKELKRQKLSFDFVGPETCPTGRPGGGSCTYLVPGSTWDTHHAAKGGTRLRDQMSEEVALVYNYKPDVLVAFFGTTDLAPRAPSDPNPAVTVKQEIEDLRTYITQARQVRPTIKIMLGEVTTRRIPNRVAFNDALLDLVKDENANPAFPDSRVVRADLDYDGWDPSRNTYDGVHPTPFGEAVIAQRVGWALRSLRVTTQSPQVSAAGLQWAVPWAPSIRVSASRRLVVNWSTSYRLYAPKLVRVRVRDLRTGRVGVTGWNASTQYLSAAKRPGRFAIAIQGRRNAMVSPWSKTWIVTVKR